MHRFRRPKEPLNFKAHVKAAADAIEKAFSRGKKEEFEDLWSDFKHHFWDAQFAKCGYCEITVANQNGDVEHYAPKGMLQLFDPKKRGRELPGGTRVLGRSPPQFSDRGYWWQAYAWENYLVACTICNSKWKKNLFPVAAKKRAKPPKWKGKPEKALLLNPFEGPDPREHLAFDDLGAITAAPRSQHGTATIETLGLDRVSVMSQRSAKVTKLAMLVDKLALAKTNAEYDSVLLSLYLECRDCEAHCGMARSFIESHSKAKKIPITWKQLQKLEKTWPCPCALHQAAALV